MISKGITSELKIKFEILKVIILNEKQAEIKIKIVEPNGETQIENIITDLETIKEK